MNICPAVNWRETVLGEVAVLQRGFDLPQQDRRPGTVPIVSSSGVSGFHAEPRVKGPGVVTGRYGTIGQVFYITDDFWPLNTTLWVKDFKGNDPLFVSYLLRTVDFLSCSDKSSVPGVNRNDLHRIPVRVPLLPEQKRIAHILGTLDDKIELNRRMNETLEAMARALFKSWFMDFDPVRAKAAGRKPEGTDDATAALFPASFVDSELGKIPRGWRVTTIEAISRRMAMGPFGSNIKSDNFVANGVPVIRGGNLAGGFLDDGFVFLTEEKADELANSNGFPGTIVFTHRGTLGQIAMIPLRPRFRRYVVSQSQMLLDVDDRNVSRFYVYLHFVVSSGMSDLLANTSTTGVPAIARPLTALKSVKLLLPPQTLSLAFDRLVVPLVGKARQNEAEAWSLVALRDALLPKLLLGPCGTYTKTTSKGVRA